ncbi:MAG: hypothetical protein E6I65_11960 [Chloroflexi bacterium]|nr:MAG: hypothetical protein E6I65_11960 [Chloroflexota bacterium]
MTRRLSLVWPDPRPFAARDGRPIRILAASDEHDPALDFAPNREALGRLDLVIGCGDLGLDQLGFLGDAFTTPLLFVRGNHDRGGPWPAPARLPMPFAGLDRRSLPGTTIIGLPWPGGEATPARRDEGAAWRQVLSTLKLRLVAPDGGAWLVVSHAPPRDAGDSPDDPYHVGFAAYRTVLERLRPRLWLHGHTTRAAAPTWRVEHGPTTLVNVTGSVLVELLPPTKGAATGATEGRDLIDA